MFFSDSSCVLFQRVSRTGANSFVHRTSNIAQTSCTILCLHLFVWTLQSVFVLLHLWCKYMGVGLGCGGGLLI